MNKYVISLSLLCTLAPCAYGMEGDVADLPSTPQDSPVAAVAPEIQPSATMQKSASTEVLDEPAQPASEAQPTETITTTKRSRIQETAKKLAALAGYVAYSPARAGRYVWNSRPCTTIVSLPGKAIQGTRNAAKTTGHAIAKLLRTIFCKLDHGTALQQYKPEERVDLTAALNNQGALVHRAHNYVLKRTFGFGTLAALIGSGSAYRAFGKNPKTAAVGLASGLATGLVSYATFRHQANIQEISLMGDRIVKRAIEQRMTATQAEEAFGNSDHALSHVGFSGLNAMRDITDKIKYLDSVDSRDSRLVVATPAEAATSSSAK